MGKIIGMAYLFILIASCTSGGNEVEIDKKIITSIYEGTDTNNMVLKRFRIDTTYLDRLPKDKEMILELDYKGEYSKLVRETDIFVLPKNNDCQVTKINNYKFKVTIDPDIKEKTLYLEFFIAPKKNNIFIDKRNNKKYENQAKCSRLLFLEVVEQ